MWTGWPVGALQHMAVAGDADGMPDGAGNSWSGAADQASDSAPRDEVVLVFSNQTFSWPAPAPGVTWSGEDGTPDDGGQRVKVRRGLWSGGRLGPSPVAAGKAEITPQDELVLVFSEKNINDTPIYLSHT